MSLKIIKIRKSYERFRSTREWLNSMHSFSFAEHRDPKWDNFGKIRVINEDIISLMQDLIHILMQIWK